MNLEARTRAVVDDRLFAAYWASVEHFGTTDLVLYLAAERDEDPVDAFVRARLLADPNIPTQLAAKIFKPAKDAADLTAASTAFWLVVSFTNEEMFVSAVVAQRIGQGGTA